MHARITYTPCEITGKRKFITRERAVQHASKFTITTYPYRCADCGWFHLTKRCYPTTSAAA